MARLRTMNLRRWRQITPINGYVTQWELDPSGNLRRRHAVLQGGRWRAKSLRQNGLATPSDKEAASERLSDD